MKPQDRSITHGNSHTAIRHSLHMVRKEMQKPNPPRHLHSRLDLHRGSHSEPTQPVSDDRSDVLRRRRRCRRGQRERLDGEGGGHVLDPAGVDLAGGDEHEADLAAGVEELERAVVVGELGAVGVLDGDVLGEGEVDGVVGDGEGGELDGVDGDLGVGGLEDGEEDDEDDDGDEDEEDCGDDA